MVFIKSALAYVALLFATVDALAQDLAYKPANVPLGSWSTLQLHTDQLYPRPDLKRIERSLVEPAYTNQPRYCLLVFGDSPFTRIWLVEDGDSILVDSNAAGDVTDSAKRKSPTNRSETRVAEGDKNVPYKTSTYELGDIMPKGSTIKHTRLKVDKYQIGSSVPDYVVSVWVKGKVLQYVGWGPLFSTSRENAAVVHFDAPVEPMLLRIKNLSKSANEVELSFCLGSRGIGTHSFAFVGFESVPKDIKTEIQVDWPTSDGLFTETLILPGRC